MRGFPQPSINHEQVRPSLFAACFCSLTRSSKELSENKRDKESCLAGDDPEECAVVACVFAWDPARARTIRAVRSWPGWGEGIQMCGWKGGLLEGGGLDDFVVFGGRSRSWLMEAGMDPGAGLGESMQWMAHASMDFLAQRYGVPPGAWSSMAWSSHGPLVGHVIDQARVAKRLIAAQWEADQLGRACDKAGLGASVPQVRL